MDKEYLIREKPLKALLLFAFPMIIGNLFQQFYTMVDSVVVGRFVSENALAAVGASYSLTNVFISIAIGGGVGASVLVSRYFGARDYRRMKTSVSTALISFLVVSLVLGGIGLLLGDQIMEVLNTPENIMEDAVTYLNIYFMGLPFLFMYNVLSAMFNALGKSRIPLYLLIFSSVFNVALDLIMVCSFHMGVAGVAWATLIAQGISAVMAFLIFIREMTGYQTGEEIRRFDKREFGFMCRIALPSILQQSTISIGMMLVQSVVNTFGSEVLAGYSASIRIDNIVTVPFSAIGNAMSPYTAQNIGAGKDERIRPGYRISMGLIILSGAIACIVLQLFNTGITGLFLGEEGTATAYSTGERYLSFLGWFYPILGFAMVTGGVLRGSGDMKLFTAASIANLSFRVIGSMILAPRFGVDIVWYVVPIGWVLYFGICFIAYRRKAFP